MFSQTNPPRKIGINLLCVPSNMAGTGYYALNLILHIVRIEKNNQYTLFLNKDLVKHFNSIEGNIKLIPFKITNVYKKAEKELLSQSHTNQIVALLQSNLECHFL